MAQVRAIDIKAQHPRIEQVDFFDITPKGNFDVVVASMVLNCVSSPLERGSMLALTRKHLTPGGHLFLMILAGASKTRHTALQKCCLTHSGWLV